MSNELSGGGADLMEMIRLTSMNVNGLSQQMGLINTAVNGLRQEITEVKDRMNYYEDNLRITRSQGKTLKRAVINRVNDLLGIEFEGGRVADECVETDRKYRGGFISRCYVDAKKAGVMAECYWETPRADYMKCIEYIEAWIPGVKGGVDGYREYLDIRRSEREEKR